MDSICNNLKKINLKDKNIILIQNYIRRNLIQNNLKKINDNMTCDLLNICIENYKNTLKFEEQLNKKLSYKKIRKTNFPSHISENIVKFAFYKKYKVMPSWDTDKGDLVIKNKYTKFLRLEVKGFTSDGPSSFGPKEYWDFIYFIDGKDIINNKVIIYEFKLSSISEKWKNLKVNNNETYYEQCNQKRRPRLIFKDILKQLEGDYIKIFDDNILKLFNN